MANFMKRIILLILTVSFGCIYAYSQKIEEIPLSGIKGVGYDESITSARQKAVNDAKTNALRRAGVAENVLSFADLYQAELDENYTELFTSQVFTDIRGAVKNVDIVNESSNIYDGRNIKVEVEINCVVLKYKTEPDLMYQVKVEGVEPVVREGDELRFSVEPSIDSYMYLFCIPEKLDKAFFVYPNEDEPAFLLQNNRRYNFPLGSINFELDGKGQQTDRLVFVFTKQNYPFSGDTSYERLMDWIFSIPPDQRNFQSFSVTILPR